MLNMFTLVVTQQFKEFYFTNDNPITSFEELAEIFRKPWNSYTSYYNGKKIKERNLVEFFSFLEAPLGYRQVFEDEDSDEFDLDTKNIVTIISMPEVAREIFKMDLPVDPWVSFFVLKKGVYSVWGCAFCFNEKCLW